MKIKYFLFILIVIFIAFFLSQMDFYKNATDKKSVKAIIIAPTIYIAPILAPTLTLTPTPTTFIVLKKASYSIAIFGDSMVDTMGEKLEYLQKALANKYPRTKFNLYNYGIGGQNVEQGLARFESSFVNKERQYPPLSAINPDVLIIGSFAYNPFSAHDRNRHYVLLKDLITKAKSVSLHVYLLAEIAPLKTGFGKGKNGVNIPEDAALERASHIIEQLDDVINLSRIENIPLINVYYESKVDGSFGNSKFVNKDDGIHPSEAGHLFTAELIVKNILLD